MVLPLLVWAAGSGVRLISLAATSTACWSPWAEYSIGRRSGSRPTAYRPPVTRRRIRPTPGRGGCACVPLPWEGSGEGLSRCMPHLPSQGERVGDLLAEQHTCEVPPATRSESEARRQSPARKQSLVFPRNLAASASRPPASAVQKSTHRSEIGPTAAPNAASSFTSAPPSPPR